MVTWSSNPKAQTGFLVADPVSPYGNYGLATEDLFYFLTTEDDYILQVEPSSSTNWSHSTKSPI